MSGISFANTAIAMPGLKAKWAPNEQEQQLPPLPDASALPKVHKE